jgi:hypothetical protein
MSIAISLLTFFHVDSGEKKSMDEERRFIVERRSDEEKVLRDADSDVARDSEILPAALRQPPKALLRQVYFAFFTLTISLHTVIIS